MPAKKSTTAFNEGKTKPPPSPPSVDVDIVQTAVNNVEVQSIGCVPSTSCSGGSVVLGRITTTVTSGNETQVTYTNQSQPILRVCIEELVAFVQDFARWPIA